MRFIVIPFYIAEGEIFMKKSIRVLLGFALVLALVAVGTTGYFYLLKDKSNDPLSVESGGVIFDSGNYVASVNGVSVITDDTGVRIFNEADKTEKVIFDKPAMSPIFDGETVFFMESLIADEDITFVKNGEAVSGEDYGTWYKNKVYSYNIKTDEVKELFTCNSDLVEFVTEYDGNLYYTDCEDEEIGNLDLYRSALCLYKYNIESKERTKLLDSFAWNERVGDKVYYHADSFYKGINYYEIYCFDLKTESSTLVTDEKASVVKIEDNAIYYLTCTYVTVDGVVAGKDHALKKTDLTYYETQTLTELDFYEAGEYDLWADCAGDEVYLDYVSTAAVYDFDNYSYNLKTNTLTKLKKDDIAVNGIIYNFGSLSVVEYIRDNDGDSDSVGELYRIYGPGKYTKIYESSDLYDFKLTNNGLYKIKQSDEEESKIEIVFIPLENL